MCPSSWFLEEGQIVLENKQIVEVSILSLFSEVQMAQIQQAAIKSKAVLPTVKKRVSNKTLLSQIKEIESNVLEYFSDSKAITIFSEEELHRYCDSCIDIGYVGIDTETTGLDRIHDTIVGVSLYYPTGTECYIPSKHIVPIFDEPYKNQLSYLQIGKEIQRMADSGVKFCFANADFDLSMIYKDLKVDLNDNCFFDVLIAARCLKEDEPKANLKDLYKKYVLREKEHGQRFSDFFSPELFPYCKPEIAGLYAANDAKITFKLMQWQLCYLDVTNKKCKHSKLEKISGLVWNTELPLIKICQNMHRLGIYLDKDTAEVLNEKYALLQSQEMLKLQNIVQVILDKMGHSVTSGSPPFLSGKDFNPRSQKQVKYLLYSVMKLPAPDAKQGTGKEILQAIDLPVTNQIVKVRSLGTLVDTFVVKLPGEVTDDSRIHAQFKQIGAATGRLSCTSPNLMNIPSRTKDIRHMFRATPAKNIKLNCEAHDDSISVLINNWDFVHTKTGLKRVRDLQIGDCVKLENDGKEVYLNVKRVENSGKNICLCNVVF